MATIVKFNRKFTQAQLDAAMGNSSIAGVPVVDGTWYIASSGSTAIYVGSKEGTSDAVLKLVSDVSGGNIEQLNATVSASAASGTGSATSRTSSVDVVNYIEVTQTNGKLTNATVTAAKADMSGAAAKAYDDASTLITTTINGLTGSVSKSASGGNQAVATSRSQAAQVVGGFEIKEFGGKISNDSSSVTPIRVDAWGAADKAYSEAVTASNAYTDQQISSSIQGLGTIMHFEGTKTSEAAIKALTNVKKGDVWINTSDHSEWVATDDIGSTADANKWEKFGTTDVTGALYKGNNTFTNGYILIADGADGKVKAVASGNLNTYGIKTIQTAYTQSATAGKYISGLTQSANGDVTVSTASLPTGSGTVGTNSNTAWKTPVVYTELSDHTLSGTTASIPAATTASDGYMPSTAFIKLNGIAAGAEVNQNAYSTFIIRSGSGTATSSIDAASKTDTFEFVQGNYITLAADTSSKKVTISNIAVSGSVGSAAGAGGDDPWKNVIVGVSGSGHGIAGTVKTIPAATSESNGYMTSAHVQNINTAVAALTWEE